MSTPLVVIDCRTFLMQRFVDRKADGPTTTIVNPEQYTKPEVVGVIEDYRAKGLP